MAPVVAKGDGRAPDGALMRRLVRADRLPPVCHVIEDGVMDQADGLDVDFSFGLARVLDGIAVLVESRTA